MEKSNRPQRNRRHSRRSWPTEEDLNSSRAAKRLFTPEIKRMLKEWLIRRRDNPYPSRDEKKCLAIETGLTYTQICNWFANWRRKLKNSERERAKKSWGHLIKNYNSNAKGNVEQFSISSEDSIWEEEDESKCYDFNLNRNINININNLQNSDCEEDSSSGSYVEHNSGSADSLNSFYNRNSNEAEFYVDTSKVCPNQIQNNNTDTYSASASSMKNSHSFLFGTNDTTNTNSNNKRKYKHKMMEKYLRDTSAKYPGTQKTSPLPPESEVNVSDLINAPIINNNEGRTLSKWLESAANFTPNKNSYYIDWTQQRSRLDKKSLIHETAQTFKNISSNHISYTISNAKIPTDADLHQEQIYETIHHKDELDAAEALANLAFNCRQRMRESSIFTQMNTISSK